jgi:hypothetical protein
MADLTYTNHGTIGILAGVSEAGKEWLEQNVQAEGWAHWGGGIAVEPRYVGAILDGAANDGLEVE